MLQEQINKETKTRKHFAINDWVTNHSLVGQVVNMEQKLSEGEVWVLWSGYSIPMNEPVVNLHPLDYEGKDLAGMSLPNGEGYCERLVYDEYSVQVEVHLEHKNSPQLWSLEKLARVQYGGKPKSDPSPDFEEKTFIPLNKIRRDGGTQPRANINHQTVLEYVEDMKKGDSFPPVVVYYDGTYFWLCDGFHRFEAVFGIGQKEIAAIVKQGTRRDAVLYSVGANAKLGLWRTYADKRRALMRLLEDEEWKEWSNVAIARTCQVSESFVRKIKKDSHFAQNEVTTYTTKHGTQAKMKTNNIGKGKQTESLPPGEDKVIIPDREQIHEDEVFTNIKEDDNNHTDELPVEINNDGSNDEPPVDNGINDVKDSPKSKRSKGKRKLINPLSIGDKVKVKDGHYFGGQVGIVTQLGSPYSVVVAFENNERDLLKLTDLDLPTELTKPIVNDDSQSVKKPVKKEIHITEGCNYKAGEGCTWYVRVPEFAYEGLKIYEKRLKCNSLGAAVTRFLVAEGILIPDPTRPLEYIINHDYDDDNDEK